MGWFGSAHHPAWAPLLLLVHFWNDASRKSGTSQAGEPQKVTGPVECHTVALRIGGFHGVGPVELSSIPRGQAALYEAFGVVEGRAESCYF